MRLAFTPGAWEDHKYWQDNDRKKLKKLNRLIEEIGRSPLDGTGQPEALRGDLTGCWSRRIDREHRLVYKVEDDTLIILQCRHHY